MKMKKKRIEGPEHPGAGPSVVQHAQAHPIDNSDLLALESQIELQKRLIVASVEHRERQKDLALAWANLSTITSNPIVSTEQKLMYRELAKAQYAAGSAEYDKLAIEIEFATRQVQQMESMLEQAKAARGIA